MKTVKWNVIAVKKAASGMENVMNVLNIMKQTKDLHIVGEKNLLKNCLNNKLGVRYV